MRREGNTLVMERKDCTCDDGTRPGTMPCDTCMGTGNGPRGGKGKCRGCYGRGTQPDFDHPVKCSWCDGNFKDARPEGLTDTLPEDIWQGLEFRVYRRDRRQSYNEYLLGLGTVYTVTDYGRTWEANDDAALIEGVRQSRHHQAISITDAEGTLCDHVGIFVTRDGYSVRPVFVKDGSDAQAIIARERGVDEGMAVGVRIAGEGGNGTLGAVYR